MSNRRHLTPGELARQDRNLAEARNAAAADPSTLAMATTHVDQDERCCWCDCPVQPGTGHDHPGYVCDGCPQLADLAVVVWMDQARRFPLCRAHWPRFVADVTATIGAQSLEYRVRPVYDENQAGQR